MDVKSSTMTQEQVRRQSKDKRQQRDHYKKTRNERNH